MFIIVTSQLLATARCNAVASVSSGTFKVFRTLLFLQASISASIISNAVSLSGPLGAITLDS